MEPNHDCIVNINQNNSNQEVFQRIKKHKIFKF